MSFDPLASTIAAAASAGSSVTDAARGAAASERGAAGLARAALFDEALLGALKARFAELKTAAR